MLWIAQSCYYDEEDPIAEAPIPTGVSFSKDVQGIFNLNCVSCHNGAITLDLTLGNSYDALLNGNYIVPFEPNNSVLVNSLKGNGQAVMPPSGSLETAEINKVVQWINEGAENN